MSIQVHTLTVMGFGSNIRVINFMAGNETHGGQVNSAAEIYIHTKVTVKEINTTWDPTVQHTLM